MSSHHIVPSLLILLVAVFASGTVDAAPLRIVDISSPSQGWDAKTGSPPRSKAAFIAGSWDFDDTGGMADLQGWTHRDHSIQPLYTHVDDFAGLAPTYSPLNGSKSLWCGKEVSESEGWVGYGNDWHQRWISRVFAVSGQVELEYEIVFDLEDGFDTVEVLYRSTGVNWTILDTHTGTGSASVVHTVSAASHAGSIEFLFRMTSDSSWSDADGLLDTAGAYVLDDLRVRANSTTISFEDFESEAVDALATNSGDWSAQAPAGFGDYAALVNGTTVLQEVTPGAENSTNFWCFFDGSPDTYACGGYPGQTAVRRGYMLDHPLELEYIDNEILSPWMPVPGATYGSMLINFELYRPAQFDPQKPGVMVRPVVYSMVDGIEIERGPSLLYYGNPNSWLTFSLEAISFLAPGASQFRIGIRAIESEAFDPGCHDASPLVDNVEICFDSPVGDLVVTNTNPDGPGSLAAAMEIANTFPDASTITFDIAGPGPHEIVPTAPLPVLSATTIVDGFSQPGSIPNTQPGLGPGNSQLQIVIDGSSAGDTNGLVLGFKASTLRGLVIHSFFLDGVRIEAGDCVVEGCIIGSDPTRMVALDNCVGVRVLGNSEPPDNVRIGGPAPADRVFLADNRSNNIVLHHGSGILVQNCFVTEFSSEPSPNTACGAGEYVSSGIAVLTGGATIRSNRIELQRRTGIYLGGVDADDVTISQNSITDNGLLGIDLGHDGVNPNDPQDADTGPNGLQNHPVLTSIDGAGVVSGTLNSTVFDNFAIELFASPGCDIRGNGEGERFLGSTSVVTDGLGNAGFTHAIGQPVFGGEVITATATHQNGSTSEFSACLDVVNTPMGSAVVVSPWDETTETQPAQIVFESVTQAGNSFVSTSEVGPELDPGVLTSDPPVYTDITTDAIYSGSIEVTLQFDPSAYGKDIAAPRLLHHVTPIGNDPPFWQDITTKIDVESGTITGLVASLSPFIVAQFTSPTGVERLVPARAALRPAYPNPFNPQTTIEFALPQGVSVDLRIFDLTGRQIRALIAGESYPAGTHKLRWDGLDDAGAPTASGIYLLRIRAGNLDQTRKLTLLK